VGREDPPRDWVLKQITSRQAIREYSAKNGYPATHFVDCVCGCKSRLFRLRLDDVQGVAIRVCAKCKHEHPIGDSADFLAEAELDDAQCPCKGDVFALTIAVALYDGSQDVRWLYIACRCPKCKLAAVYGDWKNEFDDYRKLLARA
jgi:hypothetical protein